MKKLVFVLVLFMAVLAVNAQVIKTPDSKTPDSKVPVTKESPMRAPVVVADLQKPITDNIAKDFVGYTIKEATCVTENATITYEVVVVKGTAAETLVYDKDGSFVKKLPPLPETEKK
jgi:hypothetical protein